MGSTGFGSAVEERASKADAYNSPGWRRLQNAERSQPKLVHGTVVPEFDVGARVFHQKFGYGRVASVDGDKLFVEFEKSSPRHVMAGYLQDADAAAGDVPF